MKRRYRYALNLLSLGLLVFALYLNFVRKDSPDEIPDVSKTSSGKATPSSFKKSASISATMSREVLVLK